MKSRGHLFCFLLGGELIQCTSRELAKPGNDWMGEEAFVQQPADPV